MKSQLEADLQEVVVVPGGVEAFVFDSEFFDVVVFQKAQGGAVDQAEVGGRVTCAEAGVVFLKGHVRSPMPLVLDAPVTANGLGEAVGGELLAQEVIPHFDGLLSTPRNDSESRP